MALTKYVVEKPPTQGLPGYLDSELRKISRTIDSLAEQQVLLQSNIDTVQSNLDALVTRGTFTPRIEGDTTVGVGTYDMQSGQYMRIENWIHYRFRVAWTAHTGTGALLIKGLPFAPDDAIGPFSGIFAIPAVYINCATIPAGSMPIIFSNSIGLRVFPNVQNIVASGDLIFTGTYVTT